MAQKGKKWTPAQRAKFKRTIAVKHANKKIVTAIPLSTIPERPSKADDAMRAARKVVRHAKLTSKDNARIELALELVRLVREILK